MASFLTHFSIGLLLGVVFRVPVILTIFASIFPDVDHLNPIYSRALLHNIFILILSIVLYFTLFSRRVAIAMSICTTSHVILDMIMGGYVRLLYPLSSQCFMITNIPLIGNYYVDLLGVVLLIISILLWVLRGRWEYSGELLEVIRRC